jgi:hypothetical protein
MDPYQISFIDPEGPDSTPRTSRRSAPGDGSSLASETEAKAAGVRQAVRDLARSFDRAEVGPILRASFAPRWRLLAPGLGRPESASNRAAWNLVALWCLAQGSGELPPRSGLSEAERWFRGETQIPAPLLSSLVSQDVLWRAQQALFSVPLDHDFWDLFPYVLEEHGPGSRASVMRDPSTATARAAKRKEGVFYTPSDVADFMVQHLLNESPSMNANARWLDPAAGTGVFLLAICRTAAKRFAGSGAFDRFSYVTNDLFGCDISPHSLDAAAFVLLHEALPDARRKGLTPWAAWHAIRINLAEIDSMTTGPADPKHQHPALTEAKIRVKQWLTDPARGWRDTTAISVAELAHRHRSDLGLSGTSSIPLSAVFPDVPEGFDALVGNPPYAPLGPRPDYRSLASDYTCLARGRAAARENCYPLFVEMMWRLTTPSKSAAALVTPLSIAFHSGSQYEDCRHAMYWHGGKWQFAFFDREPHALFGEEVKTRNAILFRLENAKSPARGQPAAVETGPLRKWTSRTRRSLFDSIDFTPLEAINITPGIPKLKGPHQSHAFALLRKSSARLPGWCAKLATCDPAEACSKAAFPRVFVGGTAYNFLNVYRAFTLDERSPYPLSESSIHSLQFKSEAEAQAVFAILSSRLVFWLWHVMGDGFHVAGWLFDQVPFVRTSFTDAQFEQLTSLGAALWTQVQQHRIVSVNGGKQTIAFRPLALNQERDAIDKVLIQAAGLPPSFAAELRDFILETVVVDRNDRRRQHLQAYFNEEDDICPRKSTKRSKRKANSPKRNGASTRRRSGK